MVSSTLFSTIKEKVSSSHNAKEVHDLKDSFVIRQEDNGFGYMVVSDFARVRTTMGSYGWWG